ncbi:hypothetical protein NKG94_51965 [Micromonospora sp. M12]
MRDEHDENAALRRQSLLIAIGCVIADGAPSCSMCRSTRRTRPSGSPDWRSCWPTWRCAAGPDSRAGGGGHAVVRVAAAALLLAVIGDVDSIGNATGLVVAGYRAGAWVPGRRSWAALATLVTGMTATQVIKASTGPPKVS